METEAKQPEPEQTEFQDKNLICLECNSNFVWTAGEQKFYIEHGFENEPKRCADCRRERRRRRR